MHTPFHLRTLPCAQGTPLVGMEEFVVDESTQWWVMAGVLVAVELLTGTFYLLMLAVGAAAGALAAHAGLPIALQLTAAALVGGLCSAIWYVRQRRQQQARRTGATPLGVQDDPDLSLDLGQIVVVTAWQSDGSTQVSYRGALWAARLQHPQDPLSPQPGPHRICAMQGNHLLLEKV